ncbi:tetratricopeptide repeat protein [Actinokineospora sp. 24-640]
MSACERVGCPGSYLADGTCDECGFKAPRARAARTPHAGQPDSGQTRSGPPHSGAPSSGPLQEGPLQQGALQSGPLRSGSLPSAPRRSRPSGVGGGLLDLAPVAVRSPEAAVLSEPRVPEARRVCKGPCGELVGQPSGGEPGLTRGFCPRDGTPFSFEPELARGDRVDRYEVLGCLAYGGLGWIYLARDLHLGDEVADHWVVLKGLIDPRDPDALASAVNERRFLVRVDHPNIVRILDLARRVDPHTGQQADYIVMEYLGGRTLQDLFARHRDERGERAPLPLPAALAYGAEVLDALGYLHGEGLVFCDLKPDNVMHVGDQVKLIDLGAVLPLGGSGALFGAPGYLAPELDHLPPSPASDVYSVGRMLAMLSAPFPKFSTEYRHRLPDPVDGDLYSVHESFHRLVLRATDPDPARRFASAQEMREQVRGVLVEVMGEGRRAPILSTVFGPERGSLDRALPVPLVDPADPAAGWLATLGAVDPDDLAATLAAAPVLSPEVLLRSVDARVAAGDLAGAAADLDEFAATAADDWRVAWFRGVLALATGTDAREAFTEVHHRLPGERAPKLALAIAAERAEDTARAEDLYRRVAAADATSDNAAFGIARVRLARGECAEAVAWLDTVPETSARYATARATAIEALAEAGTEAALRDAEARTRRLARTHPNDARDTRLRGAVLAAALRWLADGGVPSREPLLEEPLAETPVRRALERVYRDLAARTPDRAARTALLDKANEVRPWTWV